MALKASLMTTSHVAREAGVPETAIRNYERRGLITAKRDSNGRRLFDSDVVAKVRAIRTGRTGTR